MSAAILVTLSLVFGPPVAIGVPGALEPEDDASTGGDAGNSIGTATLLTYGSWSGNVSNLDISDFYRIHLQKGSRIEIRATSPDKACVGTECNLPVVCAQLRIYEPRGEMWNSHSCRGQTDSGDFVSEAPMFVSPETGFWFVEVWLHGAYLKVGKLSYDLHLIKTRSYGFVRYAEFASVNWVALRLPSAASSYTALLERVAIQSTGGALEPTFGEYIVALAPKTQLTGVISEASGIASIGPSVSVATGSASMHATADFGSPLLNPGAMIDPGVKYWVGALNEGGFFEYDLVLLMTSTVPFSTRFTMAWEGPAEFLEFAGDSSRIVAKRVTDFEGGQAVVSPAGGLAHNVTLQIQLDDSFVGHYRVSPRLDFLGLTSPVDHSRGGATSPLGTVTELASDGSRASFLSLLRPADGVWLFWIRDDAGIHGTPYLLFGVDLPEKVMERTV